jgi:hypothetical protein
MSVNSMEPDSAAAAAKPWRVRWSFIGRSPFREQVEE